MSILESCRISADVLCSTGALCTQFRGGHQATAQTGQCWSRGFRQETIQRSNLCFLQSGPFWWEIWLTVIKLFWPAVWLDSHLGWSSLLTRTDWRASISIHQVSIYTGWFFIFFLLVKLLNTHSHTWFLFRRCVRGKRRYTGTGRRLERSWGRGVIHTGGEGDAWCHPTHPESSHPGDSRRQDIRGHRRSEDSPKKTKQRWE